jgi:ubiquinone biosynthesis monooxygenase Coq7
MRADESRHGSNAMAGGAVPMPPPVRALMKQTARVMTGAAYWL